MLKCVRTTKIFHDSNSHPIRRWGAVLLDVRNPRMNAWFCFSLRHHGISCVIDYPACVSVQMLLHECRPSVCHSFVSFWDRCHHRHLQQSPAAHILAAVPLQTVVHSFKMWLCWQYIEYVSMWINVAISICILVQVSPAHLKTWTDKCWLGTSLCTDLHAGVMVQMKEA